MLRLNNKDHVNENNENIPKGSHYFEVFSEAKIWFMEEFEFDEGGSVSVTEILEFYKKRKENLNFKLSTASVGKAIRDAWGDRVIMKRKRFKPGQQTSRTVYHNIKFRKVSKEFDSVGYFSSPQNLLIHSGNLIPASWISDISADNTVLKLFKISSAVIDNEQKFVETRVHFEHGCVSKAMIAFNKSTVSVEKYGFKLHTVQSMKCLVELVEGHSLCKGVKIAKEDVDKTVKDKDNFVKSCTYSLNTDSVYQEVRIGALNCTVFSSKGEACKSCLEVAMLHSRKVERRKELTEISSHCNHRWLTNGELIDRAKYQAKELDKSLQRENFLRKKLSEEAIAIAEEDHKDLTSMFVKFANQERMPENLKLLCEEQQKLLQAKSSSGHRWHPKLIRLCLEMYVKDPNSLDSAHQFLILPSSRTLRYYKNSIKQDAGWNDAVLEWMVEEAKRRGLKEEDYWGGLVFDEMAIQENIGMTIENGIHNLVGFVDLGNLCNNMTILDSGVANTEPAKQILQFIYLSDSGFRFPVAHFPTKGCHSSMLFTLFWEGVWHLSTRGFSIYWSICDGAQANRDFIKLHFTGDPTEQKFVAYNMYTGGPMIFMMDCKHDFKKMRNNLEKSDTNGTRYMKLNGKAILWKQLRQAYEFDQGNTLRVHERLKEDHFNLDNSTRMRNHLAEDVLDKKMLFLVEALKSSLPSSNESLDSLIELLKHTSMMIEFYSDRSSITDPNDTRLKKSMKFLKFLESWNASCSNAKEFISSKLFFDFQSLILGMQSVVDFKLREFPGSRIKPRIMNQDVCENHFSQVRGLNGQNNNPTYALCKSVQNSIIMGTSSVSRKSNVGVDKAASRTSCAIPKNVFSKKKKTPQSNIRPDDLVQD